MATRQAPPAKPQGKQAPVPPNQTLYISNLPSHSRLQKEDVKTALYMLFSTYGPVLDIVCRSTPKMRGQGHVVFRDIQAATQAMRSLEGFTFLGQELRIQYAKGKSDIIAKLDGTYKIPGKDGADINVEMTETQQNIFNAPAPGSTAAAAPATSRGLPAKPPAAAPPVPAADGARGQKRTRDEEDEVDLDDDESDEDVAMEEDSEDE